MFFKHIKNILIGLICLWTLAPIFGQEVKKFPLETNKNLQTIHAKVTPTTYHGLKSIKVEGNGPLTQKMVEGRRLSPQERRMLVRENLVIVSDSDFTNGTIEIELSGKPGPNAGPNHRGFVGVAFRVQEADTISYECFYLRPTNGRAIDQLQRNHSVQYISHPEHPWMKLRKEQPGMYETYVDLVPGAWTEVKIVVNGNKAQLYVHGADQPTLIVNDLKLGLDRKGAVALWLEEATEAHFRNLVIRPESQ